MPPSLWRIARTSRCNGHGGGLGSPRAAPAVLTQPLHPENWAEAWRQVMPSVANSIFISTATTALTLCLALCAAYFFARQRMPLSWF